MNVSKRDLKSKITSVKGPLCRITLLTISIAKSKFILSRSAVSLTTDKKDTFLWIL